MKLRLSKIASLIIAAGALSTSMVDAQLINAFDAGRYSDTGSSNPANTNYLAGYNGAVNTVFRDFFAFNLTGITGSISNASITIFEPATGFQSNVTPLNFGLFDVTTSAATVLAGGSGLTAVYTNLGSGTSYGSTNVTAANNGSFITINLNSAFISDFIAHEGGTLIIGGAITTALPKTANEMIFNGTAEGGLPAGNAALHFTQVPEPSTYGILGAIAMIGLVTIRRIGNKSAALG